MQVHDLSGGDDVLTRFEDIARRAVERYDVSPRSTVTRLNVSENATYQVDDPETGNTFVLRVHRLGYHTREAIASELAWLRALRDEEGIRTPHVIPAADGAEIVTVPDDGVGRERNCVMFEFLPGREPDEERLVENFEPLGEVTARMHRHARSWVPPSGFSRFTWDYDAAFGAEARWGRWQDGVGVGSAEREILGRLDATLRRRLAAYGRNRERFGLIHADLRLANLLVDDGEIAVIDFDDSGYSWYLYDLGTALSFIEHHPQVPEMIDSWLRGYRKVLELSAEDEREIWTFVMYRRLLLVAWIGSHTAADIARELGVGYTAGSCDLAETYLARFA